MGQRCSRRWICEAPHELSTWSIACPPFRGLHLCQLTEELLHGVCLAVALRVDNGAASVARLGACSRQLWAIVSDAAFAKCCSNEFPHGTAANGEAVSSQNLETLSVQ
eukprot:TRINITY_DN69782_c0_g1_i1.p1 TRINITY_DN69782_c0_g1~~TRINITY_DN69782_c0_g1_i1.p1  ORF type:complete len:121 (+),score=15.10 TRINITY_DN69782_c0_g1_i1:40-363(+)